ncbi:hypothetical protein GGQ10_003218 [Salinibacter ruber]|uniref:hypothetical protein n=1 Tax=Salinibacter ruber TaxID=146919 RepID=UPI002168450E|nr:hypothetical protein [Salinibacter ruber]MCS4088371.1 hypothetical protein [Salinibacter ruber]
MPTPREADASVAIGTAGRDAPSVATARTRRAGASAADVPSQLTATRPSPSHTTSTRPVGVPFATTIGSPNCRPPSAENATLTRGTPPGAVYHAAATRSPAAASAGPLTGQPSIRHPSSWRTAGSDHDWPSNRTSRMLRTSSADRSRYATRASPLVRTAVVGQHSQVRSSSSARCSTVPVASSTPPRRVISPPCPSRPAIVRPSSQTASRRSSGHGSSETKPCSVAVPSSCGLTADRHVPAPSVCVICTA